MLVYILPECSNLNEAKQPEACKPYRGHLGSVCSWPFCCATIELFLNYSSVNSSFWHSNSISDSTSSRRDQLLNSALCPTLSAVYGNAVLYVAKLIVVCVNSLRRCVICMMDFVYGDPIRFLPCMHIYHLDCIDDWLMRSFTCPSCMEPVDAALLSSYETNWLLPALIPTPHTPTHTTLESCPHTSHLHKETNCPLSWGAGWCTCGIVG